LRARELLRRREPGRAPRVLFEWERVRGAREYLLRGQWVEPETWAFRVLEFRVAGGNGAARSDRLVGFEVSLPEGSHSWTVVAVFGPAGLGDFARPTHLSFDLGGVR
jgi:hypothetical protein